MRRLVITAAAAVAIAVSGIGIAFASIPDSKGVIHGCYTVKTGALRVIDTGKGQTCPTGQHALNWNQTGPRGPAGVSGYQVESYIPGTSDNPLGSYQTQGGGYPTYVTLYCPSGKVALSAGYARVDQYFRIPQDMYPFTDSGGSGYKFTFPSGGSDITAVGNVTAYVTCAKAS